jgi:hypothetical protein
MSSLNKRRDDVAKTQNACAVLFLFNRKAQIEKKIQTLLRDKTVDMIDSNLQLSLLRRVIVLLSTLIVKKTMNVKFKKMNICKIEKRLSDRALDDRRVSSLSIVSVLTAHVSII